MYHKVGLLIVKGIWPRRIVHDGWNRERVKDEPSWSTQCTVTGGLVGIMGVSVSNHLRPF